MLLQNSHLDKRIMMKSKFAAPFTALCAFSLIGFLPAVGQQPPGRRATVDKINPVQLQTVKLSGFWRQQAKRMTEKWLPHCIRQMEQGGEGQELMNLVALGQVNKGRAVDSKYIGLPWSDAYIYNTVEAVCLALAVDPESDEELTRAQAHLRARIEDWIPIILDAQSPDGYIHSFHVLNRHPRYRNVGWHEFYVMGYFIEMGVAHYEMTRGSDRRLYDAAAKCADHLCATFGPAPNRTWRNGHPGLEYALCRLGNLVNEVEGKCKGDKYIQLARHFLDRQHEGEGGAKSNQSDRPAVEFTEASGHAVRATYFYTAMTDIALLQGAEGYARAVDRIWDNAIHKKHYLTGGVGAKGETFAGNFELPNNGYCESCASCGLSFWADRMHRLHKDGHYRDVQERALYNNILGSVDLAGRKFFYQNPLASDKPRHSWHRCPCCVGNIPRALLGIKDLIYSVDSSRTELYLSHYVDCEAAVQDVGGTNLRIRQETRYPWEGGVKVTMHAERKASFTLRLRIPSRRESRLYSTIPDLEGRFDLRVNGHLQSLPAQKGYVAIHREWREGDVVELSLPMEVQRVHCDTRVTANRGRVALQRGPIVYSIEDVDQGGSAESFVLKTNIPLAAVWKQDLLGGIMAITAEGILAVPNFVRLNRGGASQVWLVENYIAAGCSQTSPR
jgi:uncharacterized protein